MKLEAWGKTNKDAGSTHTLAHHSMDVAAVFARMLELKVIRRRMEAAAGRALTDTDCARLAALAFLHDIGKLHPGFQAKGWPDELWRGPKRGHSKESWDFLVHAMRSSEHPFHAVMLEIMKWGDRAVPPLVAAMFAHHGRPVVLSADPNPRNWNSPPSPHYDWSEQGKIMANAMHDWFPGAFKSGDPLPEKSEFHHIVAGFAALADWIGSDTNFFKYVAPFDASYKTKAITVAKQALEAVGLDSERLQGSPVPDFNQWTGFIPNPAQSTVAAVGQDSRLLILEAETGSGKTEAALWRFFQLFASGKVSGLYFAVPTRAAARQLHKRINRYLQEAYGEDKAPEAVLAIPGMVRAGEAQGHRLPEWKVQWNDHEDHVPARWAAEHATRFLAATVAVGTVDQAMLAGLQVKHAHLRGSALCRNFLVVDEVHASDAYMTEILKQLLDSHLDTGGYAMLMSATLGANARVRWTGEALPDFSVARETHYPAVWIGGDSKPRKATGTGQSKKVHLKTLATMDGVQTANHAILEAQKGARVLVIRNTVTRAVETWNAVSDARAESLLMQVEGRSAMHHSRFAVEDRELLDKAVESILAKDRNKVTDGCIVIGTQTLEQSLDIDADYLITDLCPIDVLLQRIGRLHRHDLPRPDDFCKARVLVLLPEDGLDQLTVPRFDNGLGAWENSTDGFRGIYCDLAVLELTRRLIEERSIWEIPEMNRCLVESATHQSPLEALIKVKGPHWEKYNSNFSGTRAAQAMLAGLNVLKRSDRLESLRYPSTDEHIMTRLGEEGAILKLDNAIGPFGCPVTRITLPARWSKGISEEEADGVITESDGEDLLMTVAGRHFRYSRGGLMLEKI